jgi:uncharacterized protein YcbX
MTTVDPALGERAGVEPLQTLSTYRRVGGKAMFGVNATHQREGCIKIGDPVRIDCVK